MVRTFLLTLAAAASASTLAMAQLEGEAPPPDAVPDLAPAPADASELDALNQGSEEEFPDIEVVQRRAPQSVKIRALDKITARYKDIEVKIGDPVKFGSLEIVPRYCDKRPPEEFPETTAFLEIFDRDFARARSQASVVARDIDVKRKPAEAETAPSAGRIGAAAGEETVSGRIFSGWMFASSPALNPLEHPVYDVWVIDCRTVAVGG